ncbi:MAG: serine hydrolase, partial [Elusimicrobia bacterium]|nr:serine hydrolase [Elusimicrobiota bacterium]
PAHAGDGLMLFGHDHDELARRIRYIRAGPFDPAARRHAYQNLTFVVAGTLIAAAARMPWQTAVSRYLLRPLGMTNTTFTQADLLNSKNAASGHAWSGGYLRVFNQNLPYADWPYRYGLSAGINSNVMDLSRWMMFQFGYSNIVSRKTLDFIQAEYTRSGRDDDGNPQYYAMGWRRINLPNGRHIIFHAGVTDCFHSLIYFDPVEKIGIVLLSNVAAGNHSFAFARRFFDMYFGAEIVDNSQLAMERAVRRHANRTADAQRQRDSIVPAPARAFKYYVGKFHNELYGYVKIAEENDRLIVQILPSNVRIRLVHSHADTFNHGGLVGWRLRNPFVIFKFDEASANAARITITTMTDGIETFFTRVN